MPHCYGVFGLTLLFGVCYFISDSEKGWILNFMASMEVIFLVAILCVSHKDWMLLEVSIFFF